ncbi:winged helix-turn-helix transcriptional regulator [Streptomyces mexicanus]|jgi:hypothetical protein|uniref:winged helix-turn-helix transcriptional regulator n=1 Tax=Streptomyces mexicanus TaxID=178566 RepID=UPI001F19CB1B|nr:winged helix-turn-helix transcriptional regulator [Streptomyces mexicanus]
MTSSDVQQGPLRERLQRFPQRLAELGELVRNGSSRFGQLRQALAGVSAKMLTQTLRT